MMYYSVSDTWYTVLIPVMKSTYYVITRGYATVMVSYQDVFQLEISVDNSLSMYVGQSCSDLFHPMADFADN